MRIQLGALKLHAALRLLAATARLARWQLRQAFLRVHQHVPVRESTGSRVSCHIFVQISYSVALYSV